MQANILTMKDLESNQEEIQELDTIQDTKVFDVLFEVGCSAFYFRCTHHIYENNITNTIEFIQEDSDYCDIELLEYMKNKITNLYL